MEKLSPVQLYAIYERHTQNVRHKRMEKRYANEKKLLYNYHPNRSQSKNNYQGLTDHCINDRRDNALGKQLETVCT